MSLGYDSSIAAADPNRSAWVSANAGSGKTYTLANRVTRLLLVGSRPEKILCLTYTRAAAAEMQRRLFDVLGELAMLPDEALCSRLLEISGEESVPDDLAHARRIFALALETPGGLKIQTIHAFCQSVLGRFPREAGVAPGFRVLDEQTTRALIADARDQVLERAGRGDPLLAAALAKVVTQISEARMNEILRVALGTDRRKLERFFSSLESGPVALWHSLRRAHGVQEGDTEDSIISAFCAAASDERTMLSRLIEWMDHGSKTDKEKAQNLAEALSIAEHRDAFGAFVRALLKKDGEKPRSLVTAALAQSNPTLLAYFEQFTDRLCQAEQRRRSAYAAELSHAFLTIAWAVLEVYAASKTARSVLDYDDLISRTRLLLERGDAASWVLFKLDGGLDHILIDEAQDTSPEQWAIVIKLCEEFFAGLGARGEEQVRTIFAVGDEKQSIFSFQGADPTQFERYRIYFSQQAEAAGLDFLSEPLNTSRRSVPEILEFVDRVFADQAARDGLTTAGDPILHLPHRETAKGRIEFWPAIEPTDAPEPDPMREVDLPSITSPISKLAERIAEQIQAWLRNHTLLPSRGRAIRPGDIMILLPRREPFATSIIDALKARGIPVSGSDRMQLTDQIAIKDLIALARFVLFPEDDLTTATLLRSPLFDIDEDGLFSICHGRHGSVWQELSRRHVERREFGEAYAFLADVLRRADYTPPFEFFADVLSARGARKRFFARLGPDASDPIEEFLSLALSYELANTPSLEGFLHWIQRGGAEIKRDMERGRDEVRVMTVHGAKGLEADIVILPDTTTLPQTPSQKAQLLYDGDGVLFPVTEAIQPASVTNAKRAAYEEVMREHRRLLYVALTRAKDRLYICGAANKLGIRPGSWYRLAEPAASALGMEVPRFGETARVIGESHDEVGEPRQPEARRTKLPEWVDAMASFEPGVVIRPSEFGSDEPRAATAIQSASGSSLSRGNAVHALLARLPEIAKPERRTVAERFLRSQGIPENDISALAAETLAILDCPDFAAAFAPGSRAEVPIVADLFEIAAGARIEGRIDRLAVAGSRVLIVDFKTDRLVPADERDVSEPYIAQMACYRAAVGKIFPGHTVSSSLVWTSGPKLMMLSDRRLDEGVAAVRSRLDRRRARP